MSLLGNPESENRFLLWGAPSASIFAAVLALQDRVRFPMAAILVGDASYSLYLFHPYVLKAVEKTVAPMAGVSRESLCAMFIFVCASLLLALLAYRYFERPATSWLRKAALGRRPRRFRTGIAAPNQT
jgi:peptidoglycan/LPS O-acetylase OafA/YrhL